MNDTKHEKEKLQKIDRSLIGSWGVVTADREKADRIFSAIEHEHHSEVIKRFNSSSYKAICFEDGHRLVWVKPTDNARGLRYSKLWVDQEIADSEIFNYVILPCAIFMKRDDIVWI